MFPGGHLLCICFALHRFVSSSVYGWRAVAFTHDAGAQREEFLSAYAAITLAATRTRSTQAGNVSVTGVLVRNL